MFAGFFFLCIQDRHAQVLRTSAPSTTWGLSHTSIRTTVRHPIKDPHVRKAGRGLGFAISVSPAI